METAEVRIVKKPSFQVTCLKWEGGFRQAAKGRIRDTIKEFIDRGEEVKNPKDTSRMWGLSYHTMPDGFTHYTGYEVEGEAELPDGMEAVIVPEYTYAVYPHRKGQDIGSSYAHLSHWIEENGYEPYKEEDLPDYDPLPMKFELYNYENILSQVPEFDIYIPVTKK